MQDQDIMNFWSWFTKNSDNLHPDNYDQNILNELDRIICNWGLTWEIGPGLSKEYSLTISPNGDKHLLGTTNYIIDRDHSWKIGSFTVPYNQKKIGI